MFYYPTVLQRHSGCFSTVWLAATRGLRVTRRELLRVDVNRTCGDILDYVTAQVPAPQPNLPRPRFSLYLSSQLQYGVVIVYHKQCGFLLEEIQQTIDRLLRSKRCIDIDMAESDRLTLAVPDSMTMMEAAEGAQDPFFGLMESHQLPSPYKIHQQMSGMEAAGSRHSLVLSPHSTDDIDGFRSPPAAISLKEEQQFVITAAEYFEGVELPEATSREIDLLMDQADHFRKEAKGQQADESTREGEGAPSSIDRPRAEWDSAWLLGEESGHPAEVPRAAVALEMTPLQVAMPSPPSGKEGDRDTGSPREGTAAPPLRKPGGGRRRQLVFADPQVQIPEGAMKGQIENRLAETLTLSEVLLDLPSLTKRATPAQLFAAPCGSLLHTDLQSLWKQCTSLTTLPGHEEEEESQHDREILRTERKRRQSSAREISSESGLQPTEGSSVVDMILDMSKEDKSLSDAITPVSRWSPQEEAHLRMESIAEENVEMPEAQTDEDRDILSWISSSLQRFGVITFDSLVPLEADRTTAAHTLYKLLELLSARQLTVQQTKPFSDIIINPAALRMTA
ncbi:REC8 meiotic recombination protein b [Anarrhichthys ocellatus]|uniref:REC8 meiotic recombination protein b n=1 Tax=Anarrhichthys ocellatus TaxID=433405 RepID=UPI0012EDD961|nr:meiotic recombination protein REC8 homolog [Anarrhichthys ocellatus]